MHQVPLRVVLVIALLFVGSAAEGRPSSLPDALCFGCVDESESSSWDTQLIATAVRDEVPTNTWLCRVELRLVVGAFVETCSTSAGDCGGAQCERDWQLQAKGENLASGGCQNVFFDVQNQRGTGAPWRDISAGNYRAADLSSEEFVNLTNAEGEEDAKGTLRANCGSGSSMSFRITPDDDPEAGSGDSHWVGPNNPPDSDDGDMGFDVNCSECSESWQTGGGGGGGGGGGDLPG